MTTPQLFAAKYTPFITNKVVEQYGGFYSDPQNPEKIYRAWRQMVTPDGVIAKHIILWTTAFIKTETPNLFTFRDAFAEKVADYLSKYFANVWNITRKEAEIRLLDEICFWRGTAKYRKYIEKGLPFFSANVGE
ncbi:MAG: hypothetical protein LBN37_08500 [Bacteroidales bacterium]|nr:hypothetical protein [Bacteroidales bacterium]